MTEPENHSDISCYYCVGQAETTVFSAHNSQQIEESHHREGNDWMDTCVSLVCIQPCQLSLHNREKWVLGAKWTMKGGRFVSSGHKGPEIQRCEHDLVINSY